jgi:hypothetical protein
MDYTYSMNKNLKDLKVGEIFNIGHGRNYVATLVFTEGNMTRVEYYAGDVRSPLNTYTFSKVNLTTIEVIG